LEDGEGKEGVVLERAREARREECRAGRELK
jgi:hypothetical protein